MHAELRNARSELRGVPDTRVHKRSLQTGPRASVSSSLSSSAFVFVSGRFISARTNSPVKAAARSIGKNGGDVIRYRGIDKRTVSLEVDEMEQQGLGPFVPYRAPHREPLEISQFTRFPSVIFDSNIFHSHFHLPASLSTLSSSLGPAVSSIIPRGTISSVAAERLSE